MLLKAQAANTIATPVIINKNPHEAPSWWNEQNHGKFGSKGEGANGNEMFGSTDKHLDENGKNAAEENPNNILENTEAKDGNRAGSDILKDEKAAKACLIPWEEVGSVRQGMIGAYGVYEGVRQGSHKKLGVGTNLYCRGSVFL